jgi:hypothetical protein
VAKQFNSRPGSELRPDWHRTKGAKVYSGTQQGLAHVNALPTAKIVTLSRLVHERGLVEAKLVELVAEAKACQAKGDAHGFERRAGLIVRTTARMNELDQAIKERGGYDIVPEHEPVPSYRPEGVRKHPERKPSEVRHIDPSSYHQRED